MFQTVYYLHNEELNLQYFKEDNMNKSIIDNCVITVRKIKNKHFAALRKMLILDKYQYDQTQDTMPQQNKIDKRISDECQQKVICIQDFEILISQLCCGG